jgi:hypothetical protein
MADDRATTEDRSLASVVTMSSRSNRVNAGKAAATSLHSAADSLRDQSEPRQVPEAKSTTAHKAAVSSSRAATTLQVKLH